MHNDQDAQDVIQESCMKAFRAFDSFRGGDFRAWFFTIVRNTSFTWLHRRKDFRQLADEQSLDCGAQIAADCDAFDPQIIAMRAADAELVRRAIQELPALLREVVILREMEDLSYKEIAKIAGVPIGTVMSRLARANAIAADTNFGREPRSGGCAMTCTEAHPLLHAYLDNELDIATALQIERHLPTCEKCRKELEAAQAVVRVVAQASPYFPASAALRERLALAIRAEGETAGNLKSTQSAFPWWRRPMLLPGLAAALLVAVGSMILLLPSGPSNAPIAELIASHVRSLEANHLLDVESTDQHTVKPWFEGKVDYSPPVTDFAAQGYPLIGGRLDYLEKKKVAALIYKRNRHVINVFVWPGAGSQKITAAQGFNMIRFECNGMVCWAVSELNVDELQRFARLFMAQKAASTRPASIPNPME